MNSFAPFGGRTPHADPAAVARAILSEPRFRVRVERAPARTWWDALRDWLGDRWHQLLDAFARNVHVGHGAGVAIGDLLIAGTVFAVVIVAVRLVLGMLREAHAPSGARPLPEHTDPRTLEAAARNAANSGAYAAAIAAIFQAAILRLDARGVLRDDPARTVNECRRDVRERAPHASASFDRIARLFTAAVYAEDPLTAEHWAQARAAYDVLASEGSRAA